MDGWMNARLNAALGFRTGWGGSTGCIMHRVPTSNNNERFFFFAEAKTKKKMLRATGHRVARHLLQQRRHRGQDARRSRPLVRRAKREATVAPRAVKISEGQEFWDSPNIKMAVGMVAVIVVAKLTMLYDESQEPERLERQAKEFTEAQANLKPLTKEQWEEIQELRPRTPFESRLARNHARIRTGEPLSLEDIKDWAIDVLTDAMARKEDHLRQ